MYATHTLEPTGDETPRLEDYQVLQEFKDVFLDEIPGLPPKRDIDFTIELVLGATPVPKTPYRMITPEMLEMNMQLQEFLEKRYVKKSVPPWGESFLIVKKKDDTL